MIKEVRLDDRLIHGQVAVSWTRALGLDVLLVVNDQIVNDTMRRNALKLGVPAGTKYGFRSVEEGIRFLNSPECQKYKIMVLVNNPIDAAWVIKGLPGVERLTIGGVRKNAPYITDNLNLTKEDIDALLSLVDGGIKVGMMPTPSDKFTDLGPLLKSKQ